MAISDKLNYLIETKQLFKGRLNSLGAEIIESTTFRNYLNWLDEFYGEVSDKTDLAKNGVVGRTSQDGDPTPENPVEINNLSGDVEYKVRGKNKLPFPYTERTHTHNGVTFTINSDGSVLVNGTATGGNANTKLYGNCQEENQLKFPGKYLSGGTSNVKLRALNNHGGNYSVLAIDTGTGGEIDTSTYDIGYIEITVLDGTTINNQLIKPMVLDNLDDLKYEPYISESFPLSLGDIELCKLGDYQDRIYKDNGKWYIEKQIGKLVLDGTQNITLAGSGARRFNANYTTLGISNIKDGTSNVETANYRINSHFQYNSRNTNWGNYYMYSNWLVLFDANSVIASANDLKTWFANNLTSIYYVLATTTTTKITEENYPTLYNQLKDILDYLTQYKINNEFLLDYSSPEIEY